MASLATPAARQRITERYNRICQICGKKTNKRIPTDYPELDHLVPRSKGGKDSEWNLRLVCQGCNNRRRNLAGTELMTKFIVGVHQTFNDFDLSLLQYEVRHGSISLESLELFEQQLNTELGEMIRFLTRMKNREFDF
jgi:hypothetical protein